MATISMNIADAIWNDFLSIQPGATTAEQAAAAKAAIKDGFVKPQVLAARITDKREAQNVELRDYIATQEARLLG